MTGAAWRRSSARLTERELVDRARAGDVEAFERLTSLYADRLYSVVLRLVGDRSEAEDVLQEALLRAWRGIGRFQQRSLFFTWLYRIAVNEANRALGLLARNAPWVDVDDGSVQLPAPANHEPVNQAEQNELSAALSRAIADLAPSHRAALVLRDIDGFSTREAAQLVGIGEGAFKSRLHHARLRVRTAVGDERLAAGLS